MPRDLADVLHHLIPEADAPPVERHRSAAPLPGTAALPVLAVPVADRDSVRAAFVWNLAVEMARLGARATIVAPASDRDGGLWPDGDALPLGAKIVWADASDLSGLAHAAETLSQSAGRRDAGGVVLVRVPPRWLRDPGRGSKLMQWSLLLSSAEPRDLLESYGLAKLIDRLAPGARVGVTLHGTHRQGEARGAYEKLAEVAQRRLGRAPVSYGLLVDDLQVYRAVLAKRPIGLVHPQGPAARSLRDVAELLIADAGRDA